MMNPTTGSATITKVGEVANQQTSFI